VFCAHCGAANAADRRFCTSCGTPLEPLASAGPALPTPGPATAGPPVETTAPVSGPPLASLGDRLIAVLIDSLLIGSAFLVAGMWIATRWGGLTESGFSIEGGPALLAMAATLLVGLLYYWLCEGLFGATLGKGIMGIAVRRADGRKCDLAAALVRNFLRIVDGLAAYLVGFLIALFSPSRQRLGDHLAKTIVVQTKTAVPVRAVLVTVWLALAAASIWGAFIIHRGAMTSGPPSTTTAPSKGVVAAAGNLKLINFDFLQSKDGPPRPPAPYKTADTVYIKYDVVGFTTDQEGKIDLLLRAVAMDPNGQAMHAPWEKELRQTIPDNSPVNGSFNVELPLFVPPGTFRIDLRIEDKVKNTTLQFAPVFQVEATPIPPADRLEIRDFELSLSKEGPPVASPVLEGGGTIYMRWKMFGLQFQGDRLDFRTGLKVLSPSGKVLLEEPNYVAVNDPFVYHPPSFFLPITGHLSVPAGLEKGLYTAKFEMRDGFSNASLEYTARFEVR
jgi:uncharacterized RDD family membrane protein YckC